MSNTEPYTNLAARAQAKGRAEEIAEHIKESEKEELQREDYPIEEYPYTWLVVTRTAVTVDYLESVYHDEQNIAIKLKG
jgi:hypothetical protein